MITNRIAITILLTIITIMMCLGCYPKQIGPKNVDGKRLTWEGMNITQRKAHMRVVVIPRAGEVFRVWRPDDFAKILCTLCHGQGVNREDFGMPTDHLPPLSGDLFLSTEFSNYPDTTQLKLNRLVPEMADALGVKSFSIITRSGFGCYSCHMGPDGPIFGN